jgi:hypothetical protein
MASGQRIPAKENKRIFPCRCSAEKETPFGSAATRCRFAVTRRVACRWFAFEGAAETYRETARHVAQQQSGIVLPHSKERFSFPFYRW